MSPEELALVIDLHIDGHRQGPGSQEDTLRALSLCDLDTDGFLEVADIGCGTGASALVLGKRLNAHITAIDLAQPFLDRLSEQAKLDGVTEKITPMCAPMEDLPLEPNSFDLIWSEGAIYNVGFSAGLEVWRELLKPEGMLAVSEITWLGQTRSETLTAYWENAYPEITTVTGNVAKLQAAGYRLMGYFPLPVKSWMDEYYLPLISRIDDFLGRHPDNELAQSLVAAERSEIDLFLTHQKDVSYGFYVMQKA